MTNYAPTIVYHDLHLTLIFFSRQKRLILLFILFQFTFDKNFVSIISILFSYGNTLYFIHIFVYLYLFQNTIKIHNDGFRRSA